MKTKLFFLAAAGSLFVTYNSLQQLTARTPASYPQNQSGLSAYSTLPPHQNQIQIVYSYNDIVTTYDSAISNESILRENMQTLQGMLAQEQLHVGQQNIRDQANPYSSARTNVNQLQNEIRKVKQLRHNNLESAYMRLALTYTAIQNPPRDGRPGLTEQQHHDARLRLENIATLKQAIELENTGYYNLRQTSLTAALYTPLLINPPIVPLEVNYYDAHIKSYLAEQERLAALAKRPQQIAPPVAPSPTVVDPTRDGMVEALPEDSAVLQ